MMRVVAVLLALILGACTGKVQIGPEGRDGAEVSPEATGGFGGGSDSAKGGATDSATKGTAAGGTQAIAPPIDDPPCEARGVIAYDMNHDGFSRDLFLITADGACNKRVTSSLAQEKQPAFSHDGRLLAYASNESGNYQIWTRDLETGEAEQLTDLQEGATYPSWSPDDRQIVFVSDNPEEVPGVASKVMLLDIETMQTSVLLEPEGCCWGYGSSVFAGQDLILAGSGASLVGVHLDTQETYDVVPITGRIPNPQDPAPAPENVRVVFADCCSPSLKLELFVGRIDGTTGDTCESAFPLARHEDGLVSPTWGPFGCIAAQIEAGGIVLVAADGSAGTTPVVTGPAKNPDIAPANFTLTDCD